MVPHGVLAKALIPKRRYRRYPARPLTRLLVRVLADHHEFGLENLDRSGPYIVAGNHRGIMEVFLMVAISPRPMEILGAGDIPLDPRYRFFADFYGYIPYKRGHMDRVALTTAAKALRQGKVVGIFPEGGIWKAGTKTAHRGVAWLSFTTGAPVIPVGFGGVYRAIGRAVRLQKPYLETWVGSPLPTPPRTEGMSRRDHMTAHAQRVLEEIEALVPAWDRNTHTGPEEELFDLEVRYRGRDYRSEIAHPAVLAEYFHTPVLIDVLYKNLKRRGVSPFRRFGRPYPPGKIAYAVSIILGYVIRTNTAFFTYRLGDERASRLMDALFSLRRLAVRLQDAGNGSETPTDRSEGITIVPIHRFRMPGSSEWIERRHPPKIDRF